MSEKIYAHLKYARVGAQKARLVADSIRGKSVDEALKLLSFQSKKSSYIIRKLLDSAVANARDRKTVDVSNLVVDTIYVNEGPSLKRFRPRAQGRAYGVKKKTSHISIALAER